MLVGWVWNFEGVGGMPSARTTSLSSVAASLSASGDSCQEL